MASTDAGRWLAPERWPLPSPRRRAQGASTPAVPQILLTAGFATWIGLLGLSVAPRSNLCSRADA
jgi:hypothetical protein